MDKFLSRHPIEHAKKESFAPVAQHHLFREKDIPLDIAMEINLLDIAG